MHLCTSVSNWPGVQVMQAGICPRSRGTFMTFVQHDAFLFLPNLVHALLTHHSTRAARPPGSFREKPPTSCIQCHNSVIPSAIVLWTERRIVPHALSSVCDLARRLLGAILASGWSISTMSHCRRPPARDPVHRSAAAPPTWRQYPRCWRQGWGRLGWGRLGRE